MPHPRKLATSNKQAREQINYTAFSKLISFPIGENQAKKIITWLTTNATKPEFNADKLFFPQDSLSESITTDRNRTYILRQLVLDIPGYKKEHFSFIAYLALMANTEIEKNLFIKILDCIPKERLIECTGEPRRYPILEENDTFSIAHLAAINAKFSKDFIIALHPKIDVFKKTKYNSTPAHLAGNFGHTETLKILRDFGADLKAQGPEHMTPLELAYFAKHKNIVSFFKDDKEIKMDGLYRRYAIDGDLTAMKELKKEFAIDVNATLGREKRTTLITTISRKVFYEKSDSKTTLPLEKKHDEIIKYLLNEEHARIDLLADDDQLTAITFAMMVNHPKALKWILDREDSAKSICEHDIFYGFANITNERDHYLVMFLLVKKLAAIKNSDYLNAISGAGLTPLHYATQQKKPEAYIKLLIDTQLVDVNKKDTIYNYTPLEFAVKENNEAAIIELLKYDSVEKNQQQLIKIAIQYNVTKAFSILIDNNVITDYPATFKSFVYIKDIDTIEKHLEIIKIILNKMSPIQLATELPAALNFAIKNKIRKLAEVLVDKVTKETVTQEECNNMRELLLKNHITKVMTCLNKNYPILHLERKIAEPTEDIIKARQERLDRQLAASLLELENVKNAYLREKKLLNSYIAKQLLFTEMDSIVKAVENKIDNIEKNYSQLIDSSNDLTPEAQVVKISDLINQLKRQNQFLVKQSTETLRKNIDKYVKSDEAKEQDLVKDKSKEFRSPKTSTPKIKKILEKPPTSTPKSITPVSCKRKKPKAESNKSKNRKKNVKKVIQQYDDFIEKLGILIDKDLDEKTLADVLSKKRMTLKEKLGIECFLQSLFIEISTNAPLGNGLKSEIDFRNNNIYKIFNEDNYDNLDVLDQSEFKNDHTNQKRLLDQIAKLLIALDEYTRCFIKTTGVRHTTDFSSRSSLLNFLTEKSKDSRDVFNGRLFSEGRTIGHQIYHDTYERILSSRVINECKLLDDTHKTFCNTYLWLRKLSEGQKSGITMSTLQYDLANAWRHPGEYTRDQITLDILDDPDYLKLSTKATTSIPVLS